MSRVKVWTAILTTLVLVLGTAAPAFATECAGGCGGGGGSKVG